MDAISASLALKAMDGLLLRQTATAENIANVQTRGYRPLKVSFEEALIEAASRGPGAIEAVPPTMVRVDPDPASPGVRLDMELATAAATTGRYGALVEMLNRQLQINTIAVSGGR